MFLYIIWVIRDICINYRSITISRAMYCILWRTQRLPPSTSHLLPSAGWWCEAKTQAWTHMHTRALTHTVWTTGAARHNLHQNVSHKLWSCSNEILQVSIIQPSHPSIQTHSHYTVHKQTQPECTTCTQRCPSPTSEWKSRLVSGLGSYQNPGRYF